MSNFLVIAFFAGVGVVLTWLRATRQPTWPVWVVGALGAVALGVLADASWWVVLVVSAIITVAEVVSRLHLRRRATT